MSTAPAGRQHPLISVLIPAYNHAAYVTETVESVWRQGYPNLEIVLIDDGSRDDTFAVAQALQARSPLPMRAIRQENQGLNRTLNRALALAEGEYVAVVASDDVYCERRFDSQLALFLANPDLKIAIGNGRHWQPPHIAQRRLVTPAAIARLQQGHLPTIMTSLYLSDLFISTTPCLYQRAFLQQIGGWDTTITLDDWVIALRIFRALRSSSEYAYVDEDLFLHRVHGANSEGNVLGLLAMGLEAAAAYVPADLLPRTQANLYWRAGVRMLRSGQPAQALRFFRQSQQLYFDPGKFTTLLRQGVQRTVVDRLRTTPK